MIVSLIVAADENNAIGKDGSMPWHLPDELAYFRATTRGKPVVMGRKTWESLPAAYRPLPGRKNIVVSRQTDLSLEGAQVVQSIDDAIRAASIASDEVFIIGGQQLYELALPKADRLYLSRVHAEIDGADAFFPVVDFQDWREVEKREHPADDRHPYAFTMQVFERRR